jgi:hypothetical protein
MRHELPMRASALTRATRFNNIGLVGWAVTTGSVVVYDAWALKTKRPTMSRTLGHYLAHPIVGPVLAGIWMGLSYHLLVEELLPAFFDERFSRTTPSGFSRKL